MKVTAPCDFCGVPVEAEVPDDYPVALRVAHEGCVPTPGAGGAERILEERHRQIRIEGFKPEDDQVYENGELAKAALAYLSKALDYDPGVRQWPRTWRLSFWKPSVDKVRNLEKAGALIAAEIDRLLNKEMADINNLPRKPDVEDSDD